MKRKVLILEDKEVQAEALKRIIKDLDEQLTVYCAYNEHEAYQIAMENHIQLFLIDIILKAESPADISGLNFIQELRNVKKYEFTPVIFVTALQDPKLYAYSELHCFGYLEKPIDEAKVKALVKKALTFPDVNDEQRNVFFRKDGIFYLKRIDQIVCIKSYKRNTKVYCVDGVMEICYKSCDDFLKEMDSDTFIRCNRYVIINQAYIENIDYINQYVKMKYIEELFRMGSVMKKIFKDEMHND